MRRIRRVPAMRTLTGPFLLLLLVLAIATPSSAVAHDGHDANSLGTQQWNTFRRGLHSADDGITDDSIQARPPTTGRGLGGGRNSGVGGVGGLRGTGFGSYGAGSVGEPGPGGLGAMKNGGLGATPPRPR